MLFRFLWSLDFSQKCVLSPTNNGGKEKIVCVAHSIVKWHLLKAVSNSSKTVFSKTKLLATCFVNYQGSAERKCIKDNSINRYFGINNARDDPVWGGVKRWRLTTICWWSVIRRLATCLATFKDTELLINAAFHHFKEHFTISEPILCSSRLQLCTLIRSHSKPPEIQQLSQWLTGQYFTYISSLLWPFEALYNICHINPFTHGW